MMVYQTLGLNEFSIWNEVKGFHVYENFTSDPLLHEKVFCDME